MAIPPRRGVNATQPALELDAVTMIYGPPPRLLRPLIRVALKQDHVALDSVSLSVNSGEVVGLVGANGAGKTTLLKLSATLLEPTSGSLRVDGIDAARSPTEARSRLGLSLSDDRGLYWRLTGRQHLAFFGVMAGIRPAVVADRVAELLRWTELADDARLVFGYSSGMRGRLSLARALLADPPLLLLDEPTRSIDPLTGRRLWELITERARGGGTGVLVSTHDLSAAVEWCDRIVVLTSGRVVHSAPAEELRRSRHSTDVLAAALAPPAAS